MRTSLVLLIAALIAFTPARAQNRLRVLISVDMEGVVGAVTGDQLGPTGFEYGRFRDFMTREAVAAVTAARAAGATDVIVADAHGNGENLLIEQFPPEVRIIRSWPRQLGMVAGADQQVDAVIFIGYHASTNNAKGVRAHTFSSATLTRVALNGTERLRRIVGGGDRRPVQRPGDHDLRRRCGDRGSASGGWEHRSRGNQAHARLPFRHDPHAAGVVRSHCRAREGGHRPPRGIQALSK